MAIFIKEGIKDVRTKMTQYNPCKYQRGCENQKPLSVGFQKLHKNYVKVSEKYTHLHDT